MLASTGYGQRWGSIFTVTKDSTVFGKTLASGTVIADKNTKSIWMLTATANSTQSLLTASAVPVLSDSSSSAGLWALSATSLIPTDSLHKLWAYYMSADTIAVSAGYITTIYNTLLATNDVVADSVVTTYLDADTVIAPAGYLTTIYNTTLINNDVITEDVHASDTIFHNKITTINYSDTLAYGDSILICTASVVLDGWIAVDTIGVPIGKADVVIGSNGALAQVYTPYGCVAVGTLTAGKICVRKWGTSVYIKNNRWKHQRITYELKYL